MSIDLAACATAAAPTVVPPSPYSWWTPDLFLPQPPVDLNGALAIGDAPDVYRSLNPATVVRHPASHVAVADPLTTPVPPGHVRCVCISDTHSGHRGLVLPPGDILIHGGDFSDVGKADDILDFCAWLETQTQFRERVVIAGNHDLSLDAQSYPGTYRRFGHKTKADTSRLIARLREVSTYLDHEEADVCGLRIFGSPYQPEFGGWAFNLARAGECRQKWAQMVPAYEDRPFDILLTHGPPLGHGDACIGSGPQGCWDLLDFVESFPPKLHVFGHIHESFGMTTNDRTLFVNASTMNYHYDATRLRPPVVIDVPLASDPAALAAWRGRLRPVQVTTLAAATATAGAEKDAGDEEEE